VFFFSSRRRHTRWPRDWSSDVCSSDLIPPVQRLRHRNLLLNRTRSPSERPSKIGQRSSTPAGIGPSISTPPDEAASRPRRKTYEIGRASCRERVYRWGGTGVIKNKRYR